MKYVPKGTKTATLLLIICDSLWYNESLLDFFKADFYLFLLFLESKPNFALSPSSIIYDIFCSYINVEPIISLK